MEYTLEIANCSNPVELTFNSFSGAMILKQNGQKLKRKGLKFEYSAFNDLGEEVVISLKREMLGLVPPQVLVNGVRQFYVEPLKTFDKVISFLPVGLLAFGMIGGIFAAIGIILNIKIAGAFENAVTKLVAVVLNSALWYVVGFFVAAYIASLLL